MHPAEDVGGGGHGFVIGITVTPNWTELTAFALVPLKKLVPVIVTGLSPPSLVSVAGDTPVTVGRPAAACVSVTKAPERTKAQTLPSRMVRNLNLIGQNLSLTGWFRGTSGYAIWTGWGGIATECQ